MKPTLVAVRCEAELPVKTESIYIMAPSLTKDVKVLKRKSVDTDDVAVVKTKKAKKSVAAASPEKTAPADAATPTKKLSSAKKAAAELFASPAAPAKAAGEDTLSADAYRAKHDITVKGVPSPAVYQTFAEAPFPAPLKAALAAAGFSVPSPIQVRYCHCIVA